MYGKVSPLPPSVKRLHWHMATPVESSSLYQSSGWPTRADTSAGFLAVKTLRGCILTWWKTPYDNAMNQYGLYLWLILLAPILWLQGRYVHRVMPRLPEPGGARSGCVGVGPLIRILVAGDSAAAGVGASSQDEALCGQLVRRLAQTVRVEWCLIAATGLDSPSLMNLLSDNPADSYDVVVLSVGVNDVTRLRSPGQWLLWQSQMATLVETRFRPQLLVHCAVPPMHAFDALPQPLRWFFGLWAQAFNQRLATALSGQTRRILHQPFLTSASCGLATDGFHPGPAGYAAWAEGLSRQILSTQLKQSSTASTTLRR